MTTIPESNTHDNQEHKEHKMPDLTTHATYVCETALDWQKVVRGHTKGSTYVVRFGSTLDPVAHVHKDWSCTCPDFVLRKQPKGLYCKHIEAQKDARCAWNKELEPFVTVGHALGKPCCPRCGGPVEAIQVAV